jgi:hypothetical protein
MRLSTADLPAQKDLALRIKASESYWTVGDCPSHHHIIDMSVHCCTPLQSLSWARSWCCRGRDAAPAAVQG